MSKVLYCINSKAKNAAESEHKNFPDVYFSEIFDMLGVTAGHCSEKNLAEKLGEAEVLFLGAGDYGKQSGELKDFVKKGGTLIAFATEGLNELFKIKKIGTLRRLSEYDIVTHLKFTDQADAPVFGGGYKLPVISEVLNLSAEGTVLAESLGTELPFPLITEVKIGKGKAVYFAFSLTRTMWYVNQGRPVYCDMDGDGVCRTPDALILDENDDPTVPVTDLYMHFLGNFISEKGIPLIHQLPPKDGKPTDYVTFYVGDEDRCGYGEMHTAITETNKRGVKGYQVNMQQIETQDGYTIDKAEYEDLEKQGLTLTLHLDFITPELYRYEYNEMVRQFELFEAQFGKKPESANTHWLVYSGFGEVPRWFDERDVKYTVHHHCTRTCLADMNKMSIYGTGFGTTYPTHAYDDGEHGNVKYDIPQMKIFYYEPRVRAEGDEEKINKVLDQAAEMGYFANIFIHPAYFTIEREATIRALETVLKHHEGRNVLNDSTRALADWWQKKCRSKYEDGEADFKTSCVLKFPSTVSAVKIDGVKADITRKTVAGREWAMVVVPKGKHVVKAVK